VPDPESISPLLEASRSPWNLLVDGIPADGVVVGFASGIEGRGFYVEGAGGVLRRRVSFGAEIVRVVKSNKGMSAIVVFMVLPMKRP